MKTVEQLKDMQNYGYSFSDLWTLDEIVSMLINKVNEVIEGYDNFVQVPHIKGNFDKNETYYKFDLINYKGETYICKKTCYPPCDITNVKYFEKLSYDIDILKEAISHYDSIEEWDKYFAETSGKIEEKYTTRLNQIDSQLEDIAINVKNFGAKGDGITDDTQSFLNALDEINKNGGGTLYIPKTEGMKYKIIKGIDFTLTNNIKIICDTGVIIDGKDSVNDKLIYLHGSKNEFSPLLGNISKNSVILSTSLKVQKDDILLITSSELWNSERDYYYKGEICEVESFGDNNIVLKQPLNDDYKNLTTKIYKLNMPKIEIENLNIERDSNHTGLYIQYAKDIEIKNSSIKGARYCCFAIDYCYGGLISNNTATDCWYVGTGSSYGLGIYSCQNINIRGGRYVGGRHGITTGGKEPCRFINIEDCLCSSKSDSDSPGLDFHGNIEYCNVKNCTCTGDKGIAGNPININIENCNIISHKEGYQAIQLLFEVGKNGYINIKNNIINAPYGDGIQIRPNTNNLNIDKIDISDNTINSKGVGIYISPNSSKISSFICNDLKLKNNINVSYNKSLVITSDFMTFKNINIDNEYYESTDGTVCINIKLNNNSDLILNNSKFKINNDGNTIYIEKIKNITMNNCLIKGKPLENYSAYNWFLCEGVLNISNTTFENFRAYCGIYANGTIYPKRIILNNNFYNNCNGNFNINLTSQLISQIMANGQKICYGTSAPTSLQWIIGDRIYNTTPTIGQPKSWVCTASGIPGIWVSEGNL